MSLRGTLRISLFCSVFALVATARAETLPPFESSIAPLSPELRKAMTGVSWTPGCPVALDDLALVTVTHWGFDEAPKQGELVVAKAHAKKIVEVFRTLFSARFPIERMQRIDHFAGSDDASMAANNTSAFNCRRMTDRNEWSRHSYGTALDLNPLVNPYVTSDGHVQPAEGKAYVNREKPALGLVTKDGVVVRAFRKAGWKWGGAWRKTKDYQHFSSDGR